MNDRWLPLHCMNCLTYCGHNEWHEASCPEECDCGHASHATSFRCPTCGNEWMGLPPENWDGSLLVQKEKPIPTPPPEYRSNNEVSA